MGAATIGLHHLASKGMLQCMCCRLLQKPLGLNSSSCSSLGHASLRQHALILTESTQTLFAVPLTFAVITWVAFIYPEQSAQAGKPNSSVYSDLPSDRSARTTALLQLAQDSYQRADILKACTYYQQVLSEVGTGPLVQLAETKDQMIRAFYKCARLMFNNHEDERVEALLDDAKKLGFWSYRHTVLRRKLVRRRYHRSLANEDVTHAITLYTQYQAHGTPDEDERIWLGEQLAQRARQALRNNQRDRFEMLMRHLSAIAPQNRDYREMKSAAEGPQYLSMGVMAVILMLLIVIIGLLLISHWNAWAKIARAKRDNPLLTEDA